MVRLASQENLRHRYSDVRLSNLYHFNNIFEWFFNLCSACSAEVAKNTWYEKLRDFKTPLQHQYRYQFSKIMHNMYYFWFLHNGLHWFGVTQEKKQKARSMISTIFQCLKRKQFVNPLTLKSACTPFAISMWYQK